MSYTYRQLTEHMIPHDYHGKQLVKYRPASPHLPMANNQP